MGGVRVQADGAEKAEAHLLPWVCLARGLLQGTAEPWAESVSQRPGHLGCFTCMGVGGVDGEKQDG